MLIHIGAVVVFMGTIVTALFWQRAAERTGNPGIIAHTYHMLNRFDVLLTPISIVAIALSGVLLAQFAELSIVGTGWIFWSLVAWGASGVLFMVRLFPIQRRLECEANDAEQKMDPGILTHMRTGKQWAHWAHLTLVGIVVAFCLMVLKPALLTP